jgi:hypothetical protein
MEMRELFYKIASWHNPVRVFRLKKELLIGFTGFVGVACC